MQSWWQVTSIELALITYAGVSLALYSITATSRVTSIDNVDFLKYLDICRVLCYSGRKHGKLQLTMFSRYEV